MTETQATMRALVARMNGEQRQHTLRVLEERRLVCALAGYNYRKDLATYARRLLQGGIRNV